MTMFIGLLPKENQQFSKPIANVDAWSGGRGLKPDLRQIPGASFADLANVAIATIVCDMFTVSVELTIRAFLGEDVSTLGSRQMYVLKLVNSGFGYARRAAVCIAIAERIEYGC